jgi:protein TonB
MKSLDKRTLDDILFEQRNKEYGSYRLRKQYFYRLAISFLISLVSVVLAILGYFWYLNSAGDEVVYYYSNTNQRLRSTEGSFMDPAELAAYLNAGQPEENKTDLQKIQKQNILNTFIVTENPSNDTFLNPSEETPTAESNGAEDMFSNDSAVFGGLIPGDGEGIGSGSSLDRLPVFPSGSVYKYIEHILVYPSQAVKQKIHGKVFISFLVNKTGEVVDVKVERSIHPLLDDAAVKAVQSLPRFQPGMRHGRPIPVRHVIPINFMPLS